MVWEWDEDGDGRVSDLWHLREKLSKSGQLIYGKWFRGRATLMSREIFPALLKSLNPNLPTPADLSLMLRDFRFSRRGFSSVDEAASTLCRLAGQGKRISILSCS